MTDTTFRQDYVARFKTILEDFKAQYPDRLRTVLRTRPASLNDALLPCGWVDRRPEAIRFDAQTRERSSPASITIADRLTDNDETLVRFDQLIDLFVEHASAYAHVGGGTWDRMTVEDDFEDGFWLVRFTFTNLSEMTGRP